LGQQSEMVMDQLTLFELFAIAGAILGVWIKHQSDYSKLVGRVAILETQNSELRDNMKKVLAELQEIKLLLARNKVE